MVRAIWSWSGIERLGQDVRFALRTLRKTPGFTAAAIAVLALGTGANTAIFSIFHAVLLRPLPFHDPDRLMLISEKIPKRGVNRSDLCAANFFDTQRRNRSFSAMAIVSGRSFAITDDGPPEQVSGLLVSSSFFSVFGVAPEHGRALRAEDDEPGAPGAVILSHRLWQRRFGGNTSILGKVMLLNGRPHHVVGIMPPGFQPLFSDHELWAPMQLTPEERGNRSSHFLWAAGRLEPGVTPEQAQSDLDAIGRSLEREYPEANAGRGLRAAPLRDELVGDHKPTLMLLMGAVTLVLLVACGNVANLLLARALSRRKEMAIRMALGAAGTRVLQQLLTESFVLASLGVGGGLLVARAMIRSLPALIPAGFSLPGLDRVTIDGPVLIVVVATGVLVSVFFGCVPAWRLARVTLADLNERGATGIGGARDGMRRALLAAEVACSLVLLLGAGLLLRSFSNLMQVRPGFRADGVLTLPLQMPSEPVGFLRQVHGRIRAIPGVEDVAAIEYLPLSGSGVTRRALVEGQPRPEPGGEPIVQRHLVTPDYFRTMGIPLGAGRAFTDADMSAKHLVALINETMARRHWPNQSPLGQHVRIGTQASVTKAPPREIVGIVGDVRHGGLRADLRDEVYVPLGQDDWPVMHLLVRSAREDPGALIPEVKIAVWAIDRNQTLPNIKPLATIVANSVWQPRLNVILLAGFAAVTLALALAGLYGLMVRLVNDRTAEIGVRVAMGARPINVLLLVLREGFLPVLLGTAVGCGLAIAGGRFVAAQLYGVTQSDPLTFAASLTLIVVSALAAMMHPALRAARVDPATALRHE